MKIRGARVHNLKNISLDIPKDAFVVVTGLSGSGKSSLAFDTIHAEGQRRFVGSLSSYAAQFLDLQDKPDVDSIEGLSPTIAIDQKSSSHNPRSTVGTMTEIYDLLRVLFARAGVPHCPLCGSKVAEQTVEEMVGKMLAMNAQTSIQLFAPIIQAQKGEHKHALIQAEDSGYKQVRYDGMTIDVGEAIAMRKDKTKPHSIDVLVYELEKQTPSPRAGSVPSTAQKALTLHGLVLNIREDNGDEFAFAKLQLRHLPPQLTKPDPRLFSFNAPSGACVECTGLGMKLVLEPELVILIRA